MSPIQGYSKEHFLMADKLSRTRCKSNLLSLDYDKSFPNLRVVHKCRSYLATMGVPKNNGEHYLWPEEAIFLLEMCSAIIYSKGRPLTLLQSYRILEEQKFPHFKYLIYVSLKKGGYVVIRPKRRNMLPDAYVRSNEQETPAAQKQRNCLMDGFPSLSKDGLHIPLLHSSRNYVPFEADFKTPDCSVLQFSRDANRLAPCRPRSSPHLGNIINAKNWKEFQTLKKNLTKSSGRRYARSTKLLSNSKNCVDFELYPPTYSYHSPEEPIHRVVCFDVVDGEIDVHKLCSDLKNRCVIVAVHQHGKINFIRTSGEEIKLFTGY